MISLGLFRKSLVWVALVLITACTGDANKSASSSPVATNVINPNAQFSQPTIVGPSAQSDNQPLSNQPLSNQTDDAANGSDDQLATLLLTNYSFENQQVVPTTGWICTDVIEQRRVYYFYSEGVLNVGRRVAVERSLNANGTYDDIQFFWSPSGADSILLSSLITGDNGELLTSGRQYDMHSIRFSEVDSIRTFTADTLLRGKLVCGAFNLR